MRRTRTIMLPRPALLGALALLLCGCPWNGFDDLERDAPVQVIERPDKFSSPHFGRHFVVLHDTGFERTLVVSGQYTDPLAAITLDGRGQIKSTRIARVDQNDLILTDDRQKNLVEAMTRISDSAAGHPRFLVGVPQYDYLRRVTVPPTGDLQPEAERIYLPPPGGAYTFQNLGGALTAGPLGGGAELDWVVAEDNYTYFVLDENTNDASSVQPCAVPNGTGAFEATGRGLVTGRFFEADPAGQHAAALGVPNTSGGEVQLYRFSGDVVGCAPTVLQAPVTAPGESVYFGRALLAADLNGDGLDDLVVGSPDAGNSRVYVYLTDGPAGARTLQPAPAYTLAPAEEGAVTFGDALGLADLDGDGTPELLVSDTEAPYHTNKGRVHIFQASWATGGPATEEALIGDPSPKAEFLGADLKDASSGFGACLGALRWGNPEWPGEELIVGAQELLFAFFLTTLPGDDETGDATRTPDPR